MLDVNLKEEKGNRSINYQKKKAWLGRRKKKMQGKYMSAGHAAVNSM